MGHPAEKKEEEEAVKPQELTPMQVTQQMVLVDQQAIMNSVRNSLRDQQQMLCILDQRDKVFFERGKTFLDPFFGLCVP